MRILLAFTHLQVTGLSTYYYTVAKELKRRGHEVDVFTMHWGAYTDKMKEVASCVTEPASEYVLILLSHNDVFGEMRKRGVTGHSIYISHGLVYENDVPKRGMADQYCSISQFSHTRHHEMGKVDWVNYLPPGIDCSEEGFYPHTPINEKLTKVFSVVKTRQANDMVIQACEDLGLEYTGWAQSDLMGVDNYTLEMIEAINNADAVVGWGRTVLETMACGRVPICFDINNHSYNQGDTDIVKRPANWHTPLSGRITPINVFTEVKNNFGRAIGFDPTFDLRTLKRHLLEYDASLSPYYRSFVLLHFNITTLVDRLLLLYESRETLRSLSC